MPKSMQIKSVNWQKAYPEDMASYIKGKDELIKEIEQEAYNWSDQLKTNDQT
ncbi:hypothetical protein BsIDN1_41110 [Bacillus safensis]|uniref:Uncharacterized protein n=1 Tax=Bacillus safensis TaxID=561879 RepID=A0A5S9MBK6_BACIA|nr:hypothetical protein BsIDN1_41110 [Bacillus safensis]